MELFVNLELEDIVVLIKQQINTIGSTCGSDTVPVAWKVAFKNRRSFDGRPLVENDNDENY